MLIVVMLTAETHFFHLCSLIFHSALLSTSILHVRRFVVFCLGHFDRHVTCIKEEDGLLIITVQRHRPFDMFFVLMKGACM